MQLSSDSMLVRTIASVSVEDWAHLELDHCVGGYGRCNVQCAMCNRSSNCQEVVDKFLHGNTWRPPWVGVGPSAASMALIEPAAVSRQSWHLTADHPFASAQPPPRPPLRVDLTSLGLAFLLYWLCWNRVTRFGGFLSSRFCFCRSLQSRVRLPTWSTLPFLAIDRV